MITLFSIYTGQTIPYSSWRARMWFDSWIWRAVSGEECGRSPWPGDRPATGEVGGSRSG
ncbi:hypothetical protein OG552_13940 [Streptomyces sp. NBC_01476]|uniref:hypothetical protein n=1 Tax=Streptomyces sp. NBC_01476 TaxID=2903881 RepID=UPI002E342392|nr:hypothetical protein [Streptomyces sp. NBC_01476]